MAVLIIASLDRGEGRTTATAAIGALLAEGSRTVRLLRLQEDGAEAAAIADDAETLARVPGCDSMRLPVTQQDALVQVREAEASNGVALIEAPAGSPADLAASLSANVLLVTNTVDDLRLSDLSAVAGHLGDRLIGVLALRQDARATESARSAITSRGLPCLGIVTEDRLLAGPSVREISGALRASPLYENSVEDEALEYVMIGPITADPGQPYFYRHGRKAVVNRFDKMDLHLAALATEPECLVLTGGQQPSPYLMDRVAGSGLEMTVLLAPDGTVRTAELLNDLYGETRFRGQRKLERAIELFRTNVAGDALRSLLA
jgi:hypothetical protein